MDIENENDARQIEDAVEPLLELRNKVDCAFLVIHHASKLGTVRGSTHIQAMVDTILLLRKLNDEDPSGPRELLGRGRDHDIPNKITFRLEENSLRMIPNIEKSDFKKEASKWLSEPN
jgi:predicted ATP-dependent serine protease